MTIFLYLLLAYILYQFIFKLVVPVYLASRKIKKGFREMHERMNQQQGQQQDPNQSKTPNFAAKPKAGDYLDYEEVK